MCEVSVWMTFNETAEDCCNRLYEMAVTAAFLSHTFCISQQQQSHLGNFLSFWPWLKISQKLMDDLQWNLVETLMFLSLWIMIHNFRSGLKASIFIIIITIFRHCSAIIQPQSVLVLLNPLSWITKGSPTTTTWIAICSINLNGLIKPPPKKTWKTVLH